MADRRLTPTERYVLTWIPPLVALHDGGAHVYAIVHPQGVASGSGWVAVMVGFAAVDLSMAMWLHRRPGRRLTWLRIVLLCIDVVVCSRGAGPGHTVWVPSGVPLAIELGIRRRWWSLAVPAIVLLAAVGGSEATHTAVGDGVFIPLFGSWMGMAFGRYCRRRENSLAAVAQRDIDAEVTASALAAANEVHLASGALIDELQRVGVLLESAGTPSAARSSAMHRKALLAEVTRQSAAYLGDVLMAWERTVNSSPALGKELRLVIDPTARTLVLTREQAVALTELLARLDIRGSVAVHDRHGESRGPEADRVLLIGEHELLIAKRPVRGTLLVSPIPVMIGMTSLWCLAPVLTGDLEPMIGVMGALWLGGLAVVSARTLARSGPRALGPTWWTLVASVGSLIALSAAWNPGQFTDAGVQRFPFLVPLEFVTIVVALLRPFVARRAALAQHLSLGLLFTACVVVAGRPVQWRTLCAELIFNLAAAVVSRDAGVGFAELAAAKRDDVQQTRDAAIDATRRRVADEAARELGELVTTLSAEINAAALSGAATAAPPDLVAEARRRLDGVVASFADSTRR